VRLLGWQPPTSTGVGSSPRWTCDRLVCGVSSRRKSSKQARRVALALVATYHEAELAGLVEHVAEAIERYRAGELSVHDVDEVIHRYHKATQELWKFCFRGGSGAYAERVAATLQDLTAERERPDWWRAAERRRG
jgi:hypothetical protein